MNEVDFGAHELRALRTAWTGLRSRWDLTPRECRELFPEGGDETASPPAPTEARMRILIEIGYRIGLPEDALHTWLRTGSPVLGWSSPLDAMSGSMADLRGIRRLVEEGFAS